jgi:endo-1,4-beta-xylanase
MNDAQEQQPRRRRGRARLIIGAVSAVILTVAAVAVAGPANAATQICSNQTGNNGGNYYQMWTAGQGSACITLNSSNSYASTWSGIGDFVAGVGWNPGSTSQAVTYTGSLNASGGTNLLSLYGWSTNPLVEYYVIDGYVGSPNYAGTNMGTMTSDGGTYTIIKHQQVNQPSIQGTTTFWQYLAIRNSPRTSGTITFPNFVNAWASHAMNLGTMNYQIMATEAWGGGSGNSNVTVNHGTSTGGGGGGGGGGGCTATLSAGTVGNNWYNLNVAVTGSNTWTVTVNMASPAVVYNTWNINATFPSQYVMTAKPNGSGNNWGFTVATNGQWTWPSISCSPS